jgi:hypothetical protein
MRLEVLEDRSLPSVNFQALGFLGDPAPGAGSGGSLTHSFDWEPGALNNRGQMVFGSDLSPVPGDATGANDVGEGVFVQDPNGTRTALARVGDTAPDGATFGPNFFGEIRLNNSGDGVFSFERQPLPNPFIAGVNGGLYRFSGPNHTVTAALLPGAAAPGGGTFDGFVFRPTINDAGTIGFVGIVPTTIGPGALVGLGQGDFLLDSHGHVTDVVQPGDTVTLTNGRTVTFDWAQNPSVNNKGDVAVGAHITADPFIQFGASFPATLTQIFTAESIYFKDGQTGKMTPIAVQGGPAPGGKTFTYAFGPVLNDSGDIAFAGALPANPPGSGIDPVNNDNNIGVYLNRHGQNIVVAQPGDAMPGGGHLVSAGFFTLDLGLNNQGVVCFSGKLDTSTGGIPDSGIYTWSRGTLTLVARTGTVIPGVGTIQALMSPGEIGAVPTVVGGGEAFNNRGQVLFQATLTNGRGVLLLATPSGEPVLAADAPPAPVQQTLTTAQLQPVLQAAIAGWQTAGASPMQIALLKQVPAYIAPLPALHLGEEAAGQIWISPDASGWDWYTDVTAASNQAFAAGPGSPAAGHMDLLSVVSHELGHVLGLPDSDNTQNLMGETLAAGVRRLPTTSDVLATGVQPLVAASAVAPVSSSLNLSGQGLAVFVTSIPPTSVLTAPTLLVVNPAPALLPISVGGQPPTLLDARGPDTGTAPALLPPSTASATAPLDQVFAAVAVKPLDEDF